MLKILWSKILKHTSEAKQMEMVFFFFFFALIHLAKNVSAFFDKQNFSSQFGFWYGERHLRNVETKTTTSNVVY